MAHGVGGVVGQGRLTPPYTMVPFLPPAFLPPALPKLPVPEEGRPLTKRPVTLHCRVYRVYRWVVFHTLTLLVPTGRLFKGLTASGLVKPPICGERGRTGRELRAGAGVGV